MAETYVVLTSKPGQFRTEPGPGLVPLEAWDYFWGGRLRARFVIARLDEDTRVAIHDEAPPHGVNRVRTKFLPRHASLDAARAEIGQLARHGGAQARLEPSPL